MATLRFTSIIAIRGINPYVLISAPRVEKIKAGWRKPLPVRVRINQKPEAPWRINLMPVGNGDFYLYLHEYVRKASGTAVGNRVRVEVEFDPDYKNGPQHPTPAWFAQPLAQNPRAKKAWNLLSPSRKKEILRYFAALKSPEAQARNVDRALHVLSGKGGRFMARSW